MDKKKLTVGAAAAVILALGGGAGIAYATGGDAGEQAAGPGTEKAERRARPHQRRPRDRH